MSNSPPKRKGPATIDWIAQLANTSTATVSRVLNRKPGVAEATRVRILELSEQLGYRPNRIAQSLALKRTQTIGLIAADLVNPAYVEFFRHIHNITHPLGFQVLISDSDQNVERERDNISTMRQHRADGLFIFPVRDWNLTSDDQHLRDLQRAEMPLVTIARVDDRFDWVTSEEHATAAALTLHLTQLGHRRILFVGDDQRNRPVRERLDGMAEALAAVGMPHPAGSAIPLNDEWQICLHDALKSSRRPTAIVFANDVLALMATKVINAAGLSVPRDLSIVAFENGIWTQHMSPPLTTTSTDLHAVATAAFEMLKIRMDENLTGIPAHQRALPMHRLISQKIHLRESTAGVPS